MNSEEQERLQHLMLHYEKNSMGNSPEWRYAQLQLNDIETRLELEYLRERIARVEDVVAMMGRLVIK